MDSFRRNQEQFKTAVEGAFAHTPFADIAKRNMQMFESAAKAFKPTAVTPGAQGASAASKDEEIATLKAELSRLQDRVEKLDR